jgi:hypothetical protein
MADAKIEIKVGAVSFSGEGDGKWLSDQLDKLIEKLPQLANAQAESDPSEGDEETRKTRKGKVGTLAAFLKEKLATANQVKKFLATAVWLHDSNGQSRISTGDVKKTLRASNQGKLTNPAACLNKNVAKGHCEKDGGNGFFVTEAGRSSLG